MVEPAVMCRTCRIVPAGGATAVVDLVLTSPSLVAGQTGTVEERLEG